MMTRILTALAVAGCLAFGAGVASRGHAQIAGVSAPTHRCEPPAYLLATESQLGKVAAAVKAARKLDILVVGSMSSSLPGAEGMGKAYPARLEAALRDRLAGVTVNVTSEILPKRTAEDIAPRLGGLVNDRKPTLTIWQTGTADAIRSVDPEDFREAVDEGVAALQQAGSEVVLVNPQYSPRLETMISLAPYLDGMRIVAQHHDVPLFDRFAIMRHWNEAGEFDLFGPAQGMAMAREVHDCLGQALATFVIEAARINPVELRVER